MNRFMTILPLVVLLGRWTPRAQAQKKPAPLVTYESYLRTNSTHPAILELRKLPQEAFKETPRAVIAPSVTTTGATLPNSAGEDSKSSGGDSSTGGSGSASPPTDTSPTPQPSSAPNN